MIRYKIGDIFKTNYGNITIIELGNPGYYLIKMFDYNLDKEITTCLIINEEI